MFGERRNYLGKMMWCASFKHTDIIHFSDSKPGNYFEFWKCIGLSSLLFVLSQYFVLEQNLGWSFSGFLQYTSYCHKLWDVSGKRYKDIKFSVSPWAWLCKNRLLKTKLFYLVYGRLSSIVR